jgi:hypothetical protein
MPDPRCLCASRRTTRLGPSRDPLLLVLVLVPRPRPAARGPRQSRSQTRRALRSLRDRRLCERRGPGVSLAPASAGPRSTPGYLLPSLRDGCPAPTAADGAASTENLPRGAPQIVRGRVATSVGFQVLPHEFRAEPEARPGSSQILRTERGVRSSKLEAQSSGFATRSFRCSPRSALKILAVTSSSSSLVLVPRPAP